MAKQRETLFKEKVLKDLALLPHTWVFKTQEVSKRGIPDILICCNGHFIALELKVEENTVDPLQCWTLNKITAAGGLALPTYPKTWPRILGILKTVSSGKVSYRPERAADLEALI